MVSQWLAPEVCVAIAFQPGSHFLQALLRTNKFVLSQKFMEFFHHTADDLGAAYPRQNTLLHLQVEGHERIEQLFAVRQIHLDLMQNAVPQTKIGFVEYFADLDNPRAIACVWHTHSVTLPGICGEWHWIRQHCRLRNLVQVNTKKLERVGTVYDFIADGLRRLIDVNGSGKEEVVG